MYTIYILRLYLPIWNIEWKDGNWCTPNFGDTFNTSPFALFPWNPQIPFTAHLGLHFPTHCLCNLKPSMTSVYELCLYIFSKNLVWIKEFCRAMFCLLAVLIYLCVLVCKKGFLCSCPVVKLPYSAKKLLLRASSFILFWIPILCKCNNI